MNSSIQWFQWQTEGTISPLVYSFFVYNKHSYDNCMEKATRMALCYLREQGERERERKSRLTTQIKATGMSVNRGEQEWTLGCTWRHPCPTPATQPGLHVLNPRPWPLELPLGLTFTLCAMTNTVPDKNRWKYFYPTAESNLLFFQGIMVHISNSPVG